MNIFEKAGEAIYKDRHDDYGDALLCHEKIAKVWSGLLMGKLTKEITPQEVALMMVGLKAVRETFKHKEDNLVDGSGYFGVTDLIEKALRARRVMNNNRSNED